MSLGDRFRRIAERVSEFHSGYEDAPFVCLKCGNEFDREYHSCPDCGRNFVVRKESDDPAA